MQAEQVEIAQFLAQHPPFDDLPTNALNELAQQVEVAYYRSQTDILTLGQYLKPDRDNLDVSRYYTPEEFDQLKVEAETMGFKYVFSGPLVRSSYFAEHVFEGTIENDSLFGT